MKKEQYERYLGDIKDLTRYLRNITKEMEIINTRDRETSSKI